MTLASFIYKKDEKAKKQRGVYVNSV